MTWGLSDATIARIRGVLTRFSTVDKAVLYGSRAKGTFKPSSDIDLTLYGPGLTHDTRAAIAEELDELLLPYEIDLSVFQLLEHPALREHIERVGVLFWQREPGDSRADR